MGAEFLLGEEETHCHAEVPLLNRVVARSCRVGTLRAQYASCEDYPVTETSLAFQRWASIDLLQLTLSLTGCTLSKKGCFIIVRVHESA